MTEELIEQLDVIERMIQEGRRTIERWGWAYVMWGVGHLLGVLATVTLPPARAGLAWGALMVSCGLAMAIVGRQRRKHRQVRTQSNRALGAVWWTFGLMLIFLCVSAPIGDSPSLWLAFFSAVYGGAFFASGHIVNWTPMKVNGLLWWGAGLAMRFSAESRTLAIFAAMALVGEVGFGVWATIHEREALQGGK